ncbi:methionine/alanine import family NSS transporter small subunit [Alkalihalobacillus sp. 1P02AB]
MSTSAIIMLIISTVIVWGGMILSILNAVRVSRKKRVQSSL